jgi:hypothetical protein
MPGHTGTGIIEHSAAVLGQQAPADWTQEDVLAARRRWSIAGRTDHEAMTDAEIRAAGAQEILDMKALGMPAEEAADVILDGVRNERWRILIGTDTESLDTLVRESPETAYDEDFVERWRTANALLMKKAP